MLLSTYSAKLGRWQLGGRSRTDDPVPCGETTLSHPNNFVWHELMTTDADAAETFYSDVVGWRTRDAGMPGMRYTILSVGDAGGGGTMRIPPNAGGRRSAPMDRLCRGGRC